LNEENYTRLEEQRQKLIQRELAAYEFINARSRDAIQERADFELRTYEAMAARSDQFSAGALARQKERYLEAQDAARNWRAVQEQEFDKTGNAVRTLEGEWDQGFKTMSESVEDTLRRAGKLKAAVTEMFTMSIQPLTGLDRERTISQYRQAGDTDEQALERALTILEGKEGRYAPRDNQQFFQMNQEKALLEQLRAYFASRPRFDSGVTNFDGGLAYVHKDEMLVNLPRGTDVIPAANKGGGSVSTSFHFAAGAIVVQGAVVGSMERLADNIGAAILAKMKLKGYRT
jgi:hypothetical protein